MTIELTLKQKVILFLGENNELAKEVLFEGLFLSSDEYNARQGVKYLKTLGVTCELLEHQAGDYDNPSEEQESFAVYRFTAENEQELEQDVVVKFDGTYSSYNGDVYDKWFFVKAVPKQAFDYIKV